MSFEAAADALYAGSLSTFVAERKRLAGELRAAGDKAGAAAMNKLGRPGQSAWVVNQLYRQARADWDALLAATDRLRQGDLSAVAAQRAVVATLRARAVELLKSEGNAASEVVLGRVETNLFALAATGWIPDAPGRLIEDRAPPGFDALAGFAASAVAASQPAPTAVAKPEVETPAPRLVVVPPQPDLEFLTRRVEERSRDCEDARIQVERAQATVARVAASLASAERELHECEARVVASEERLAAAKRELDAATS
jgi:cell division septum initiation protein DivIVA